MHEYLKQTIEKFKKEFQGDNRITAMFLYGSAGRNADDEYSDVDLGVVIKDGFYNEVRNNLKGICESVCGKIYLFFPEGESEEFCNYAFLFEANRMQFLYDLTIMSQEALKKMSWLHSLPVKVIFDKTNMFSIKDKKTPGNKYDAETLIKGMEQYLLYTYLNGKYYRRADINKLLYIQNFLFNNHMKMLNALYPDEEWTWWPDDIKKLPKEKQAEMLIYFGSKKIYLIKDAIEKEIELFAYDAKKACEKWKVDYPQELEDYVKRHLRHMGVL